MYSTDPALDVNTNAQIAVDSGNIPAISCPIMSSSFPHRLLITLDDEDMELLGRLKKASKLPARTVIRQAIREAAKRLEHERGVVAMADRCLP